MEPKKNSSHTTSANNNEDPSDLREGERSSNVLGSSISDSSDKQVPGSNIQESQLIDLNELRLSQNYSELTGVKKALLTVPVRKPNRQEFIRVREGESWSIQTAVLELKEERETYMIDRCLWSVLSSELTPKVLHVAINRQDVLFIWPIRLPGEDGRLDNWNKSALEAAKIAENRWISVKSNMALGAYEVWEASADIPEPDWPDYPFQKIIQIAFRDNYISSEDHPVIKRLRGEF